MASSRGMTIFMYALGVVGVGLLVAAVAVSSEPQYLSAAVLWGVFTAFAIMGIATVGRRFARVLRRREWVYITFESKYRNRAERLMKQLREDFDARVYMDEVTAASLRSVLAVSATDGTAHIRADSKPVTRTVSDRELLSQSDVYVLMVTSDSMALVDTVHFAQARGTRVVRVAPSSSQSGDELGVETVSWPAKENSRAFLGKVATGVLTKGLTVGVPR